MNNYTPGPWRTDIRSGIAVIYFGEENQEPCIEGIPKERRLAEFFGEYHEDGHYWTLSEEKQSNARLMAAAPDLLEAAKVFLSYGRKCPPGCPCGYDEAENNLRKAIAKAEGKTP